MARLYEKIIERRLQNHSCCFVLVLVPSSSMGVEIKPPGGHSSSKYTIEFIRLLCQICFNVAAEML
jgi:hypothetical protein